MAADLLPIVHAPVCNWCGDQLADAIRPCSDLIEVDLRSLAEKTAAGADTPEVCEQQLRSRGYLVEQ